MGDRRPHGEAVTPSHRHSVGRLRAREYERLQAAAKRARDFLAYGPRPMIRGAHTYPGTGGAFSALARFCRPRIPLAGAQTPRALRAAKIEQARAGGDVAYLWHMGADK